MHKFSVVPSNSHMVCFFLSSDRINGPDPGADEAEAAVLIVMYNRTSPLPPLWHVGGLGEVSNLLHYLKQYST